jgi:hypothetical protein
VAKNKTFFGRLIADVIGFFGSIFSHVMKGAEKTFDELPQETQDALIHGSGVMNFINLEVGKLPEEIEAGILAKFPDINIDALKTGLIAVAKGFNLQVDENSIPDLIAKIQAHISSLQGSLWDTIIQGAANILAIFLAPAGTKAGAITSLMEYVYRTFFSKKNK